MTVYECPQCKRQFNLREPGLCSCMFVREDGVLEHVRLNEPKLSEPAYEINDDNTVDLYTEPIEVL